MDDTRDPSTPHGAAPTPDAPDGDATATDAAVARVRAADPAAGATPDAARLHARLAQTTGVTIGDELATARARRRRPARWLQVAAVVAGVALVGGGGYAVGAAGDAPAAPPLALLESGGAASAGQEMAMADASRMVMPGWFGGRTVFRTDGLEGAAGSARAWALDATRVADAASAARVAQALGVAGEPRQEWGQWVVGPNDGTGATVQVGVDGQASVWFYDNAWDPSLCGSGVPRTLDDTTGAEPGAAAPDAAEPAFPEGGAEGEVVEPGEGVASLEAPAPSQPAPADPSVCDPATTPTGDAAVERARELVAGLGVDVAGYEFTVSDDTGVPGLVSVTGAQVVDGTQTGLGWSVQLAGTGVQSLSGPLAPLVELGTYDHVSADEAVDRLNDPRFGATFGGVMPLAATARAADGDLSATMEAPVDEPTVPPVPSAGARIPWPVQDVTITSARLGVTQLASPDGAVLLVPAWELTAADGNAWSVVAVVEDQLDLGAA